MQIILKNIIEEVSKERLNLPWRIQGGSDEQKNVVEGFLVENSGFIKTIEFVSLQTRLDSLVYGLNPWDYVQEIKINMVEQGFLR